MTTAMTRSFAVLLACLLSGCAAELRGNRNPVPAESPSSDGEELARADAELGRWERELSALRAQATPPDCGRIQLLAGNICTLANRICEISARTPSDRATDARCQDGRARCQRAVTESKARCATEK